MDIEERIRREIGAEIVRRHSLPIKARHGIKYTGRLSIEAYREYFPNSDNCSTAYLTLKKISGPISFSQGFAKVIAGYFALEEEKQAAVESSEYEKAGWIRDLQKMLLEKWEKK
jgi:hypothetical protein